LLKRGTSDAETQFPSTHQREEAKRRSPSQCTTSTTSWSRKMIPLIAGIVGGSTAFILLIYAEVMLLSK